MDDDAPISVEATLTYSDAETVEVRAVHLGLSPSIYIEPGMTDEGFIFKIRACDLDKDDLAEILSLLGRQVAKMTEADPA